MNNELYITDLLKKGRAGDRSAFKLVYETYVLEMLGVSRKITNSLEDAEDVIQESFLKSFEKLDNLQDWKRYRAWLKRIVINASLQKIRTQMKWEELEEVEFEEETVDGKWYEGISFEEIKKGIEQLPVGCRQIFTLYLLEDYKHREIAELLNISISTSKSQYRYAIHLLKGILELNYLQ